MKSKTVLQDSGHEDALHQGKSLNEPLDRLPKRLLPAIVDRWDWVADHAELLNVDSFTRSKSFKPNFTPGKARILQQFWHFNWTKLANRLILEHKFWQIYQHWLDYTQKSFTSYANLPKTGLIFAKLCFSKKLPQPANIFTRICPSYPWHFATLRPWCSGREQSRQERGDCSQEAPSEKVGTQDPISWPFQWIFRILPEKLNSG